MQTTSNSDKELLTIDEMAQILGVQKSWLYSRTKLGQAGIPHVHVGKYIRFKKEKVLEFLDKQSGL